MNNQIQTDTQTNIDPHKYLVTQKCSTEEFSQEQINKDLEAIKKAESRSKQRMGITMGKEDNPTTRAMSALRLINPFKGV